MCGCARMCVCVCLGTGVVKQAKSSIGHYFKIVSKWCSFIFIIIIFLMITESCFTF